MEPREFAPPVSRDRPEYGLRRCLSLPSHLPDMARSTGEQNSFPRVPTRIQRGVHFAGVASSRTRQDIFSEGSEDLPAVEKRNGSADARLGPPVHLRHSNRKIGRAS